jgi:hypothetical protein
MLDVFCDIFNNISVLSWRPSLVMENEENGVSGKKILPQIANKLKFNI